jgi:hypothetical protein
MMSKLIIEMDMPKNCEDCLLCETVYVDFEYCKLYCLAKDREKIEIITEGVPTWCPIKGVLPDEHGDLIDRDKLKRAFCNHCDGDEPCAGPCVDIGLIETAPIVIAAERSEHGTTAD